MIFPQRFQLFRRHDRPSHSNQPTARHIPPLGASTSTSSYQGQAFAVPYKGSGMAEVVIHRRGSGSAEAEPWGRWILGPPRPEPFASLDTADLGTLMPGHVRRTRDPKR
jgi:hypothetical protein